jgi:hypothetical protein
MARIGKWRSPSPICLRVDVLRVRIETGTGTAVHGKRRSETGPHPYAVIPYDYWQRRFGKDPGVISRAFRNGNDLYQIVGVAPEGFFGTETGTITDVFVPTMMIGSAIDNPHVNWFRTWVRLKLGVGLRASAPATSRCASGASPGRADVLAPRDAEARRPKSSFPLQYSLNRPHRVCRICRGRSGRP